LPQIAADAATLLHSWIVDVRAVDEGAAAA